MNTRRTAAGKPVPLPDTAALMTTSTCSALNVTLVHQDFSLREWAAQVCDQVARLVGRESFQDNAWEICRLSDPGVLAKAVQSAAQADVIVVSLYDANAVPAELTHWIDRWLPCRRRSAGVLVALIGVDDQINAQFNHVQDYLRGVARQGGLDFLLRERWLPAIGGGSLLLEKSKRETQSATLMLEQVLRRDCDGLEGGDEGRAASREPDASGGPPRSASKTSTTQHS